MVSFNTTVRQMTEMFQWPKCLSRNDQNVSAKKTAFSNPCHTLNKLQVTATVLKSSFDINNC